MTDLIYFVYGLVIIFPLSLGVGAFIYYRWFYKDKQDIEDR